MRATERDLVVGTGDAAAGHGGTYAAHDGLESDRRHRPPFELDPAEVDLRPSRDIGRITQEGLDPVDHRGQRLCGLGAHPQPGVVVDPVETRRAEQVIEAGGERQRSDDGGDRYHRAHQGGTGGNCGAAPTRLEREPHAGAHRHRSPGAGERTRDHRRSGSSPFGGWLERSARSGQPPGPHGPESEDRDDRRDRAQTEGEAVDVHTAVGLGQPRRTDRHEPRGEHRDGNRQPGAAEPDDGSPKGGDAEHLRRGEAERVERRVVGGVDEPLAGHGLTDHQEPGERDCDREELKGDDVGSHRPIDGLADTGGALEFDRLVRDQRLDRLSESRLVGRAALESRHPCPEAGQRFRMPLVERRGHDHRLELEAFVDDQIIVRDPDAGDVELHLLAELASFELIEAVLLAHELVEILRAQHRPAKHVPGLEAVLVGG